MHSIRITQFEIRYSPPDHQEMLFVSIDIFRDNQPLETRNFIYGLMVDEASIIAEMQKLKATLDSDYQVAVASAQLDASRTNAENLQKSLTGKII